VIFIVAGPGGVGKGTVVSRLLELRPDLGLSRSWTTRDRRPGEPEDAYVFVDPAAFQARIDAGGFLEWTKFGGTGRLYGTPTLDPTDGRDTVLEIELDGATQVKEHHPDAVLIVVVAPSRAVQEARLRGRGDDEQSVARRLEVGDQERRDGERIADHVVVNDDVDRAARAIADIIDAARAGRQSSSS
jgi:guanylate kinase